MAGIIFYEDSDSYSGTIQSGNSTTIFVSTQVANLVVPGDFLRITSSQSGFQNVNNFITVTSVSSASISVNTGLYQPDVISFILLKNSKVRFEYATVASLKYFRGMVFDDVVTASSVSTVISGSRYRIVTVGTTSWTSLGAAASGLSVEFTASRNGTTGDGTGTVVLLKERIKGDSFSFNGFTATSLARGNAAYNDAEKIDSRIKYIRGGSNSSISLIKPSSILFPTPRYRLTTGTVSVSSITQLFPTTKNSSDAKTTGTRVVVMLQGGGAAGRSGGRTDNPSGNPSYSGPGGGGGGGTILFKVNMSEWSNLNAGSAGSVEAVSDQPPLTRATCNGGGSGLVSGSQSISANGGSASVWETYSPRNLGRGGSGGGITENPGSKIYNKIYSRSGGTGGTGGHVITGTQTVNPANAGANITGISAQGNFFSVFAFAGFDSASFLYNYTSPDNVNNFTLIDNGMTVTRTGGLPATEYLDFERGGGGGASHFGNGGNSRRGSAAVAGVFGSGGGAGLSAGFNIFGEFKAVGAAGSNGFVIVYH
jgi:hypothetical protein